MFVFAVVLPSRLQTGSTIAAIVAKFSITSVHPSRFPFPTLVLLSTLEFATVATQNSRARLSGRGCLTLIVLTLHT